MKGFEVLHPPAETASKVIKTEIANVVRAEGPSPFDRRGTG